MTCYLFCETMMDDRSRPFALNYSKGFAAERESPTLDQIW